MGAFHAYDIRGVYNRDFDKEVVYKVGYFLPELLESDKVLIGRDVRSSSPEIREYLIEGITDRGADVYDIGLSTTPMLYFATSRYNFDASVQITASHNSKEYNGLKVSKTGALPVGYANGLNKIEEWVNGREVVPQGKKGELFELEVKEHYIEFLKGYQKEFSNLKIALDLSNGMAALLAKEIFGEESERVHYLFDTLDGTFPNHDPNPLVLDNVRDLQRAVVEKGSDIGVIFDGDADRVMFIDELGEFISPDLIIAILGHYFLEERGERGAVLQDIRSSKAVGEYLTPMGGVVHTWKVGRAFAAYKLREIDGLFGGELAGHYYFKEFFYSDSAMMAALIVLGVLSKFKGEGRSLSQLIASISPYKNSGEINFKVEQKSEAMELLKEYFTKEENPTAFFDFDGYRVEFKEWWFNVRPSNTEPYLRFIAEATSQELLDEKVAKTKELIGRIK